MSSCAEQYIQQYLKPTSSPNMKRCTLCPNFLLFDASLAAGHFNECHRNIMTASQIQVQLRQHLAVMNKKNTDIASDQEVTSFIIENYRGIFDKIRALQPVVGRACKITLTNIKVVPATNPTEFHVCDVEVCLRHNGFESLFTFHRDEDMVGQIWGKHYFLHLLFFIRFWVAADPRVKEVVRLYYMHNYDLKLTKKLRKIRIFNLLKDAGLPELVADLFAETQASSIERMREECVDGQKKEFMETCCRNLVQLPGMVAEKGTQLDTFISTLTFHLAGEENGKYVSITHRIAESNPIFIHRF